MKGKKIPFFIYIILVVGIILFSAYYVFNYTNQKTYTFSKDGYVILFKKMKVLLQHIHLLQEQNITIENIQI